MSLGDAHRTRAWLSFVGLEKRPPFIYCGSKIIILDIDGFVRTQHKFIGFDPIGARKKWTIIEKKTPLESIEE